MFSTALTLEAFIRTQPRTVEVTYGKMCYNVMTKQTKITLKTFK